MLAAMTGLCRTDAELARIASARAYNFHNLLGDPAGAAAVLDEALAVVTDAAPRLQLLGRLATMKVFEADAEGALAAASPLLDSEDDATVSRGSYVSSISLALLGRGDQAVAVAYAGLERHRLASGVPQLPEVQLVGAVMGHAAAGRLDRAEADAATGYQACLAAGDKEGQATFLFLTGGLLIEGGQLGRASRAFTDAASVNRELHDSAALRWCLAGRALAEAMSGHTDRARAAAAERDELPVSPMLIYETELIDRSTAWVSVSAGELTQACDILRATADRAAASRLHVAEARVLHDVARLGPAGVGGAAAGRARCAGRRRARARARRARRRAGQRQRGRSGGGRAARSRRSA